MDHTLAVKHEDVLRTNTAADQNLHAGNGGSTGTQADHPRLFNLFALQLEGIDHAGCSYDGSTMLVIVEDGHVALFDQRALNFKALGRFDVFQIDTTEGICNTLNCFDKRLRALGIDFNIEDINSGKALEQYALAFHNRLACQRTQVTQTKNRRTIRDDSHQVALGSVLVCVLRVLCDLADRFGNPGAIRQGKVAGGLGWLGDFDTQLTRPRLGVIFKGCFFQILRHCHCSVCHV